MRFLKLKTVAQRKEEKNSYCIEMYQWRRGLQIWMQRNSNKWTLLRIFSLRFRTTFNQKFFNIVQETYVENEKHNF